LILFIVLISIFSGCFSLTISYLFYGNSIEHTMKQNQTKIAENILLLHSETDFPLEKIISIDFSDEYEINVVNDISAYNDLTRDGDIIYAEKPLHSITTIIPVEDKYVVISNKPKKNLFFYITLNSFLAISYTLIFISIMVTMFSKKFLMPIRNLNYATGEVAKGNFNIKLPIPNEFELASLTAKFNTMVKELNSIETLRNDFISNVSHEIKTPIATIQGFSNLLKDDTLSKEDRDEYLDIIISETSRISNLTSNILKLTKLETQEIITDKVSFSLDEQLRHSVLLLQRDLNEKNLNIDIELDEVQIYNNEDLLQQVWINLISNAIKFTDENGKISIQLMDTEDTATVKITDTGIGMKAESLSHIFDKFYQEDKSHSSNGNGLGLALVKRIVDLCDGTIRVKSMLGEGSSFTVELPKNNIKIEG
ncbi:MAG: ATP-binding protein, partial [Intestinibacter sp.]